MTKSLTRFAFAIAVLLAASGAAQATGFYACAVAHAPPGVVSGVGTHGYVTFNLYSLPNCGGSYIGSFSECSTGATLSSCQSYSGQIIQYSEAGLLALYQNLAKAVSTNQPISIGLFGPGLVYFYPAGY